MSEINLSFPSAEIPHRNVVIEYGDSQAPIDIQLNGYPMHIVELLAEHLQKLQFTRDKPIITFNPFTDWKTGVDIKYASQRKDRIQFHLRDGVDIQNVSSILSQEARYLKYPEYIAGVERKPPIPIKNGIEIPGDEKWLQRRLTIEDAGGKEFKVAMLGYSPSVTKVVADLLKQKLGRFITVSDPIVVDGRKEILISLKPGQNKGRAAGRVYEALVQSQMCGSCGGKGCINKCSFLNYPYAISTLKEDTRSVIAAFAGFKQER